MLRDLHFWRKGKRIGNKVKLIINEDSFSTIDIHSDEDLYMAKMAMKYKKRKMFNSFVSIREAKKLAKKKNKKSHFPMA